MALGSQIIGTGNNYAQEAAGRQSHIDAQLGQLEQNIKQLAEVQQQIEQRLVGVIRSTAPEGKGVSNQSNPREVLVPMAERIRSAADSVRFLHEACLSLLGRLEV